MISSVAVERIFDALTVVALLTFALLSLRSAGSRHGGRQSVAQLARAAGVAGMVALLLAVMVVAAPLAAEKLVRRLLPCPRLADRIVDLIEGVRQGLRVLRSPGRLAGVIFWSLVTVAGQRLGVLPGVRRVRYSRELCRRISDARALGPGHLRPLDPGLLRSVRGGHRRGAGALRCIGKSGVLLRHSLSRHFLHPHHAARPVVVARTPGGFSLLRRTPT